MVLREITYFPVFGVPLIAYLGVIVLLSFLSTAYIGMQMVKGNPRFNIGVHKRVATVSILLALLHGILGLLAYL